MLSLNIDNLRFNNFEYYIRVNQLSDCLGFKLVGSIQFDMRCIQFCLSTTVPNFQPCWLEHYNISVTLVFIILAMCICISNVTKNKCYYCCTMWCIHVKLIMQVEQIMAVLFQYVFVPVLYRQWKAYRSTRQYNVRGFNLEIPIHKCDLLFDLVRSIFNQLNKFMNICKIKLQFGNYLYFTKQILDINSMLQLFMAQNFELDILINICNMLVPNQYISTMLRLYTDSVHHSAKRICTRYGTM